MREGVYRKRMEVDRDKMRCRYRRGEVGGDKSRKHQKPAKKRGARSRKKVGSLHPTKPCISRR